MELTLADVSWTGPVRPDNQDACGYWVPATAAERSARGSIAVIADGVGGQARGDLASRLAVEMALTIFRQARPDVKPATLMRRIFLAAGHAVHHASGDPSAAGMATTLSVCIFRGRRLTVGHVGDARVYLLRGEALSRLTADHTHAEAQRAMGLLKDQDFASSPMRHVLTRALGRDAQAQPDVTQVKIEPGDRVILCTDGLHGYVSETALAALAGAFAPGQACRALIDAAGANQSQDNVTAVVAQVEGPAGAGEEEELAPGAESDVEVEPEAEAQATGGALADAWTAKSDLAADAAPDSGAGVGTGGGGGMAPGVGAGGDAELEPGELLDGRFLVIELIARSGMASIYRAVDSHSGAIVALKSPFAQFRRDPGFVKRFELEERIGLSLAHPAILRFLRVEGVKSRSYVAMEFIEGQTLDQATRAAGRLSVPEALSIMAMLCRALDHLHSHGVVHRDLKPQNVMRCADGSIRLMDFGIAALAADREATRLAERETIIGTPDYIAPERVRGDAGDARADIYSLGAMLYEMVTGRPPFEGVTAYAIMEARLKGDPPRPAEVNPAAPLEVEAIILKAMARRPEQRYASAAEMAADLDDPSRTRSGTNAAAGGRASARRGWLGRWIVWLIAGLAVAGAVAALRVMGWA